MNVQFCTFAWTKQTKFNFKVKIFGSLYILLVQIEKYQKVLPLDLARIFSTIVE